MKLSIQFCRMSSIRSSVRIGSGQEWSLRHYLRLRSWPRWPHVSKKVPLPALLESLDGWFVYLVKWLQGGWGRWEGADVRPWSSVFLCDQLWCNGPCSRVGVQRFCFSVETSFWEFRLCLQQVSWHHPTGFVINLAFLSHSSLSFEFFFSLKNRKRMPTTTSMWVFQAWTL